MSKLELKLRNKTITVVWRQDPSGTTESFTRALSSFSDEWRETYGVTKLVPTVHSGTVHAGNFGAVREVQRTPNSIGYADLRTAMEAGIEIASMVNKANRTVQASPKSLMASSQDLLSDMDPERLTVAATDSGARDAWPIVAVTYWAVRLSTWNSSECFLPHAVSGFFL